MFQCLVSAKFSMTATVLSQAPTGDPDVNGHYESKQDPDTGDIVRVWVVDDSDPVAGGVQPREIKCMVRPVIAGGIIGAANTERFTPQGVYDNIDYVKMTFPANTVLTKRDRITNIKNQKGDILWIEEESDSAGTVFEVQGVNPILDPFGNHVENLALLKRAEVQQYGQS
jgi:hypothetical protein